jgi:hypothetical protein
MGDKKGTALFLLARLPKDMENLGTRVAEVLEDRGLEKKGRFQ